MRNTERGWKLRREQLTSLKARRPLPRRTTPTRWCRMTPIPRSTSSLSTTINHANGRRADWGGETPHTESTLYVPGLPPAPSTPSPQPLPINQPTNQPTNQERSQNNVPTGGALTYILKVPPLTGANGRTKNRRKDIKPATTKSYIQYGVHTIAIQISGQVDPRIDGGDTMEDKPRQTPNQTYTDIQTIHQRHIGTNNTAYVVKDNNGLLQRPRPVSSILSSK